MHSRLRSRRLNFIRSEPQDGHVCHNDAHVLYLFIVRGVGYQVPIIAYHAAWSSSVPQLLVPQVQHFARHSSSSIEYASY
jgi:hypothetical protein